MSSTVYEAPDGTRYLHCVERAGLSYRQGYRHTFTLVCPPEPMDLWEALGWREQLRLDRERRAAILRYGAALPKRRPSCAIAARLPRSRPWRIA